MSWRRHPVVARLRSRWIRWKTGTKIRCTGRGHRVEVDGALLFGVKIDISGEGNQLSIGPNARLWNSTIYLRGTNLRCVIGNDCKLRHVVMTVEDEGSRLVIRQKSSGTGCNLLSCEGSLVQIGEDCMMSSGADIRNSDGHSVLELETGGRINPAADVIVGDHAWIGLRVQILKGVTIGDHSIAAAGCVVVKDVPPHTVVAGIPAKPMRSGITWDRQRLKVVNATATAGVAS